MPNLILENLRVLRAFAVKMTSLQWRHSWKLYWACQGTRGRFLKFGADDVSPHALPFLDLTPNPFPARRWRI